MPPLVRAQSVCGKLEPSKAFLGKKKYRSYMSRSFNILRSIKTFYVPDIALKIIDMTVNKIIMLRF